MRLFGRTPKVDPLGQGVWRRAYDRFVRSVDRVHQGLDALPEGSVRDGVAAVAQRLAEAVPQVQAACAQAQAAAPSAGLEIPGGHDGRYLDAHRELSRAATAVAQCAESVTMARVALRGTVDGGEEAQLTQAGRHVEAAGRSAEIALSCVTRSCAAIAEG